MKKSVYIIAAFVVSGFLLQAGQVKAQSSGVKEKEEAQKRALLEEQYLQQEKEVQKAEQKYRQARDIYRIKERDGHFLVAPPAAVEPFFYSAMSDKSFSLSLKKNFTGETITKKTSFTVDKDQKKLRIGVKGNCQEGSISVKFTLPSGKTFSQIEIDASADIDWSQSLQIDEESTYKGPWNVEIKANKAKGMYIVSITSY
jgi:hypothetical protein